jgi:hypothetical protein
MSASEHLATVTPIGKRKTDDGPDPTEVAKVDAHLARLLPGVPADKRAGYAAQVAAELKARGTKLR